MSRRERGPPIPVSPSSLHHPTRANREFAEILKTTDKRFKREKINPDEISLSSTSEPTDELRDLTLNDAPESARHARKQEDMSKPVLFYGKPSQLDDVITHVTVKCLADNVTTEQAKSGYLASLYRGAALTWLTNYLKDNQLDDYGELVAQTRAAFGLTEEAQQGMLTRQLAKLRQRKSVQHYALQFQQLQLQTNLPTSIAKQYFIQGLKPHIQRALIIGDDKASLADAITEATRIDGELYNVRQGAFRQPSGGSRQSTKRDGKGRYTSHIKTEEY